MKKLAFILFVLLAVETYGVFGAFQADRVLYTCTLEAGPLCYQWEESTISKVLGKENAEKMENKLSEARDAWEEGVLKRLRRKEKGGLQKLLNDAEDAALEGVKSARDVAERALDKLQEDE